MTNHNTPSPDGPHAILAGLIRWLLNALAELLQSVRVAFGAERQVAYWRDGNV